MGRKEKMNEQQKTDARERSAAGATAKALAPLYGVSRATIKRLRQ
jgi:hypothetical protein